MERVRFVDEHVLHLDIYIRVLGHVRPIWGLEIVILCSMRLVCDAAYKFRAPRAPTEEKCASPEPKFWPNCDP